MLFPNLMNFRFGNNSMVFGFGMPMFSIINLILVLFNLARNWYQNHRRDEGNANTNENPHHDERSEGANPREETEAAIRPVTNSLDMIIIVIITVVLLLYSIFSSLICCKIVKADGSEKSEFDILRRRIFDVFLDPFSYK